MVGSYDLRRHAVTPLGATRLVGKVRSRRELWRLISVLLDWRPAWAVGHRGHAAWEGP